MHRLRQVSATFRKGVAEVGIGSYFLLILLPFYSSSCVQGCWQIRDTSIHPETECNDFIHGTGTDLSTFDFITFLYSFSWLCEQLELLGGLIVLAN